MEERGDGALASRVSITDATAPLASSSRVSDQSTLDREDATATCDPKHKTVFLTSEVCERHDIPGHPESPERTRVIRERLLRDFPTLDVVRDIPHVTKEQLLRFHTEKQLDGLTRLFGQVATRFNAPGRNGQSVTINIDEDTSIMESSEEAAFVAAGAVCHAIDLVMSGKSDVVNAFCGVRPPGHHAEPQRVMGFCLFNNIGIGACHLLETYGSKIERVLILDFDVHHGNGTQAKFFHDSSRVCFVSTHQGQFYPFTGKASECGTHNNILNVPLPARTASKAYRSHFERHALPAIHAFKPDFILISAGFDAQRLDPLANIALETDDYYWITKHVTALAWKYAQGRIVSSLEGGYHLEALAASAAAHVQALIEGAVPPKPQESNETATKADIDALSNAFATAVGLDELTPPSQELRVTIHFDGKDKVVVLKDRTAKALLQSCKNKFPSLKKKAKTISIQDAQGTAITDAMLGPMADGQHLYLR